MPRFFSLVRVVDRPFSQRLTCDARQAGHQLVPEPRTVYNRLFKRVLVDQFIAELYAEFAKLARALFPYLESHSGAYLTFTPLRKQNGMVHHGSMRKSLSANMHTSKNGRCQRREASPSSRKVNYVSPLRRYWIA